MIINSYKVSDYICKYILYFTMAFFFVSNAIATHLLQTYQRHIKSKYVCFTKVIYTIL